MHPYNYSLTYGYQLIIRPRLAGTVPILNPCPGWFVTVSGERDRTRCQSAAQLLL